MFNAQSRGRVGNGGDFCIFSPRDDAVWVPPSQFVRSTRKYVVRSDDALRLKLAEAEDAATSLTEQLALSFGIEGG